MSFLLTVDLSIISCTLTVLMWLAATGMIFGVLLTFLFGLGFVMLELSKRYDYFTETTDWYVDILNSWAERFLRFF
jgi:hypothetical protein